MSNFAEQYFLDNIISVFTRILIIIIDYFRGITIEITSYEPNFIELSVEETIH
ncbi:hypothetical protein SHA02_05240 [Salisediminibacterium halotolerans]|nr:hypothetical protein SHA02_05240 [Salisediminibacterium halotolerans]